MDRAKFAELSAWLTESGLAGEAETVLLDGFCRRAIEAGVPLARAVVIIDTLHPVYEGRGFRWRRDGGPPPAETGNAGFWDSIGWHPEAGQPQTELVEYGPTNEGEAAENWRRSVFFHMLENGHDEIRLDLADRGKDFSMIGELVDKGHRHFVGYVHRFGDAGTLGQMDAVYTYFTTRRPDGF